MDRLARKLLGVVGVLLASWSLVACRGCEEETAPAPKAAAPGPARRAEPPPPAPEAAGPLEVTVGNALARSPDERWLWIADEDRKRLTLAPVPLGAAPPTHFELPGRPAQLVTDGHWVWLTLRDPGQLWIGERDGDRVLERARIPLADDAWGLVVAPDRSHALVTSAWTHRLTRVDLAEKRVSWSVDTAREPRGVVLAADGHIAYVSHLMGGALTRVLLAERPEEPPKLERLDLPVAPLRALGERLDASLGYALVLSPDGRSLFAPRHALGARGKNAWFGAATVDVWSLEGAGPRVEVPAFAAPPTWKSPLAAQLVSGSDTATPGSSLTPFTQPRAIAYRKETDTLLVLGEGDDRVAELDALAPDPTMAVLAIHQLGEGYHHEIHVASRCAAPTGLVLSKDEDRLWVYCRASNDLVELALGDAKDGSSSVTARAELGADPLGPGGSTGRKLFYGATDHVVSGGLACAGCHPEGRDDGHVWHQATFSTEDGEVTTFVGHERQIPFEAHTRGYPRRTPVLAGRVMAEGPYGWHGESPTLADREIAGFGLHRWGAPTARPTELVAMRARALADFARRGLIAPPRPKVAPSARLEQGRLLFLRADVGCTDCHPVENGYTLRRTFPLAPLPTRPGFDPESDREFEIPALTFLAERAPYFHDGSAGSLEALIENNGDRMGKTSHLSAEERAALVDFLRTL